MERSGRRSSSFWMVCCLAAGMLCILSLAATAQVRPHAASASTSPAMPVFERVTSENDLSALYIHAYFEPRNWFFHRVFLDTDRNPATGFTVPNIQNGAEYLVEGAFLYRYTGSGQNWSWQQIGSVGFTAAGREAHWRIDRSAIGESAGPNFTAFRVHLEQFQGEQAHSGLYLHHYPPQNSQTAQQLAIPSYIWSGDTAAWQRLLASDPLVLNTVMINVFNGPWTTPVPEVAANVNAARNQGRRVLGYVYTQFGNRSLADVLQDIDRYYQWYRINGIFVDESDFDCDRIDYYMAIRARVTSKGADQQIFTNPGRSFEECLLQYADVVMGFETAATTYLDTPPSWVLPPFADRYPRARFWHVVHSTTPAQMEAVVARSKQLYAGRLWVTSDIMDNPYDTFPDATYYNTLVRLATETPTSASALPATPAGKRPLPKRTPRKR